MKPSPTDKSSPPHRWRNLVPLTGLTASQIRTVCTVAGQPGAPLGPATAGQGAVGVDPFEFQPDHPGAGRVVWHQPIDVDRIIHHLVPVLAGALRSEPTEHDEPWIIDGALIPVHDQSITAISLNYRRSVNTQIIICAHRRRVLRAGRCRPGNRTDVIVARHTVTHLLDGRDVLGDRGYRGITSITTSRRDQTGRIIHDHHYRTHRRIRARVAHVIARLKDWQILHQWRRRGQDRNHILQIIAGL